MTHEEKRKKAVEQLLAHIQAVCSEYDVSVIAHLCLERKFGEGVFIQDASQYMRGTTGSLTRMLSAAIIQSDGYKELLSKALSLSQEIVSEGNLLSKEKMN